MFNTKNAITVLLIVLGLTLFYLWYSTWHRNISTNSLNKQLLQEKINNPSTYKPISNQPIKEANVEPSNNTINVTKNQSKTEKSQEKEQSDTNKVNTKASEKTIPKKPLHLKTKKAVVYRNKISKPTIRKPTIKKPTKPYVEKSFSKSNSGVKLQLQKNYKNSIEGIKLKNGTYQVGAFKHFYDALSLSIQLKSEGKHAKIIHQNGFYKVIVY
jgi:hypothetical protein